jgi:5-methylcytosine-specific restriction endonuclease McrA
MQSTLVLNASFEPWDIISARKAVQHILNGKAVAVDNSPRFFHTGTEKIEIPYVIRLNRFVKKEFKRAPSFSRRGVLVRDNFSCAYCGSYASTIDHVVPSSQGGLTSYDNCVAACGKCNNKKSDKSLKSMGWTVNFTPKPPSRYVLLLNKCKRSDELHRVWTPYIQDWVKA